MEANKANHQANIVRIEQVLPHPDPETTNLELIPIGEYQVVVRKGEFKVGDLGVYIQPDSVVPQTEPFRFIWEPYLVLAAESPYAFNSPVPAKKRRVTVRKFRKEWSEGLLMPIADFGMATGYGLLDQDTVYVKDLDPNLFVGRAPKMCTYNIGDDVADLLGITHYEPESNGESTTADTAAAPKRKFRYPKTLKGWMKFLWSYFTSDKNIFKPLSVDFTIPTYDVESLKNYPHAFEEGEPVFVTEKIHGSNARYIYINGEMYAGSHFQWKKIDEGSVWGKILLQHQWIVGWCIAHPGMALYGEAVPTQGKFNYGCKKNETKFFVFDVWDSDEGTWIHHTLWSSIGIPEDSRVPVLYVGPYSRAKMQELVDGPSTVPGANHAREGIVIKTHLNYRHVRGIGRLQMKLVSNAFLKKDSE